MLVQVGVNLLNVVLPSFSFACRIVGGNDVVVVHYLVPEMSLAFHGSSWFLRFSVPLDAGLLAAQELLRMFDQEVRLIPQALGGTSECAADVGVRIACAVVDIRCERSVD